MAMAASLLVLASILSLLAALIELLVSYIWRPLRIYRALRGQGIPGPPFRPVVGELRAVSSHLKAARASPPMPYSSHHVAVRVVPHLASWSARYGKVFSYGFGTYNRVVLGDPELCKELLKNNSGHFPKGDFARPDMRDILADGLVTINGEKWAQHRRIVNPAFYLEKLKGMTPIIIGLVADMLKLWQAKFRIEGKQLEIDVYEAFRSLTADIISHTAFGSNYNEGKQVFELQYEQQQTFAKLLTSVYIPGSRYLPTPFNRRRWKVSRQINSILGKIVEKRFRELDSGSTAALNNDLLGLMLAALKEEEKGNPGKAATMTLSDIIAECKTFYFAGHETTSTLLTWAVFLLSVYPEWQEKAREEVVTILGSSPPDAESLNKMKLVGMILSETLRLYPPVLVILRKASKNLKLGNQQILKGTTFLIPICILHVDPQYWGSDSLEFNPERFADGISKACSHPMAFLPFSTGPRNCIGQNFAMIEAKVALCMMLQRFKFIVSPGYKHSPASSITLQPEHGMQILIEPCSEA